MAIVTNPISEKMAKDGTKRLKDLLASIENDKKRAEMAKSPDNGCICAGCGLLRTNMGQACLKWMRGFVNETRQAIDDGADPDNSISIELNGPSSSHIKGGRSGVNESYASFTMKLKDVPDIAPDILHHPDTEPLRELYGDDPVLMALFDWIDKRHGVSRRRR